MDRWDDIKQNITSLSDEEIQALEITALIVSKLIARRKALGWTQEELAEKVGMKQSAIARIERAESIPKLDTLHKLARGMGLRIDLVPDELAAASA